MEIIYTQIFLSWHSICLLFIVYTLSIFYDITFPKTEPLMVVLFLDDTCDYLLIFFNKNVHHIFGGQNEYHIPSWHIIDDEQLTFTYCHVVQQIKNTNLFTEPRWFLPFYYDDRYYGLWFLVNINKYRKIVYILPYNRG